MANNKVVLGNETLIDLTGDTVASNKMLTGTTAHDASGTAISGSISSGSVSLTLTPSSLTPSTSPNKYVTSASASLDYSSLTAQQGDVLNGKTFIGKNGVQSGSLVASQVQTGTVKATDNTHMTISGLTGTPSNLMLMYDYSSAGNTNYQVYALYYINSTYVHIAKTNTSMTQRRTSGTVAFSSGSCAITLASDRFIRGVQGDKYQWVVW